DERLAAALARLDTTAERHCFEFRHPSWFAPEVYMLLREHGVALVIGDRPEVHAFQTHEFTAGWAVVRFHQASRGRGGDARDGGTASTGLAAVACLERGDVDMAVLDVLMPGISGDAVADRLRRVDPDLPVLLMTGADTTFTSATGLPVLRKPFPQDELVAAVK